MSAADRKSGKVTIVGAGPGSPDLITLRGLRALRRASVVFYDALVHPGLLMEAPAAARKIFVGKRRGCATFEQREINRRIVAEAKAGNEVVRLKGGDPFVFGRGGEEALACREAGIEFEIVPGVCSALGAASHAGIPLTHRSVSSSVAFVTARDETAGDRHERRLAELARSADTLVVFMGGSRLRSLADSLAAGGISRSASVAVISQATLESQKTVLGTVENIAERVEEARLAAPMLIIIGEVVNLAPALNWFERRLDCTPEALPVFRIPAGDGERDCDSSSWTGVTPGDP